MEAARIQKSAKQHGRSLAALERRQFVLEVRKSGASYREIARLALDRFGASRLPAGWDERYAYKDLMRVVSAQKEAMEEDALVLREIELARLDTLQLAIWKQAVQGDYHAIDRILRISQRRGELVGLDAAIRLSMSWEKEAQEKGLDAAQLFEELVQTYASAIQNSEEPTDFRGVERGGQEG